MRESTLKCIESIKILKNLENNNKRNTNSLRLQIITPIVVMTVLSLEKSSIQTLMITIIFKRLKNVTVAPP